MQLLGQTSLGRAKGTYVAIGFAAMLAACGGFWDDDAVGSGQLEVLHVFDAVSGAQPSGGLFLDADGRFYGTTRRGGAYQAGTAFRIDAAGHFELIAAFGAAAGDPVRPNSLVRGPGGDFYGTTGLVGDFYDETLSSVFRMTPAGEISVLHTYRFDKESGGLTRARDGTLYGAAGGDIASNAEVFRIDANGQWGFVGRAGTGAYSTSRLTEGRDGQLYGIGWTASEVFRVAPDGRSTQVRAFDPIVIGPPAPDAGLLQARDGNFYGITSGEIGGEATLFRVTPEGDLAVLRRFERGTGPQAQLVEAADGFLYGTTPAGGAHGAGTLFRIGTDGTFSVLHHFENRGTPGFHPTGPLCQGPDGHLYGMSADDSASEGATTYGTIYRFTLP